MDHPKRLAIASRIVGGVSGATTLILEHARGFAARGWDVHVYGERLDMERIRQAGAVPHRLPGWPWGSVFKRRLFAWMFERARRRAPFDLVCGHGDILSQDVLILHNCVHAAHETIYGAPLSDNSGVGRIHGCILKERAFRLLIANSELMKQDVARRFHIPATQVTVVYPCYDPVRFRPEDREKLGMPVRHELNVGSGEQLVGLVTSGDFRKRGVEMFLGALGRLPADVRKKVHALVVGKENDLGPYRRKADKTGLGPRIHFLPPVPQVERYHHALDVFFYPALFEEFGLSVLEAMACGVPVLTSARVGASELLEGRWRDALLDRPEEEAFAHRLAHLLEDAALRKRMAEGGLAACRGNTWEAHVRRVADSCEVLLASTPPRTLR